MTASTPAASAAHPGNPDPFAALVEAVAERVLARLTARDADGWIDQAASPLGRKLHCQLVRGGVLPGHKAHRRVLVRRRDVDAYIESHPSPLSATNAIDTEAELLARVGARRVAF